LYIVWDWGLDNFEYEEPYEIQNYVELPEGVWRYDPDRKNIYKK